MLPFVWYGICCQPYATAHIDAQILIPASLRPLPSYQRAVWDTKTGAQLMELRGHTDSVNSVGFSSNGNRIIFGSTDKSVRVWDARTGWQLKQLLGHTGSPRSRSLLLATKSSLDLLTDQCDCGMRKQVRLLQLRTPQHCRFSPDGLFLVAGTNRCDLDTPWVANEDGWILSGAEKLVWVPSTEEERDKVERDQDEEDRDKDRDRENKNTTRDRINLKI